MTSIMGVCWQLSSLWQLLFVTLLLLLLLLSHNCAMPSSQSATQQQGCKLIDQKCSISRCKQLRLLQLLASCPTWKHANSGR